MAATREQIVEALFAALVKAGTPTFVTTGRRNRDPEGMDPAETPALFLVEHSDKWERTPGYNQIAKREMQLRAILYYDTGTDQNAIPSAVLNPLVDAFEAAFTPDNRQTNTFTLGGLVAACLIDGESVRASGDVTGKGLAVIPIRILFP